MRSSTLDLLRERQAFERWVRKLISERRVKAFFADLLGINPSVNPAGASSAEWPAVSVQMFEGRAEAATLAQPYGLRAVPPEGSTGVVLPLNGGEPLVVLAAGVWSTSFASTVPLDLVSGEVALWSVSQAQVRLTATGEVLLNGTAASPAVARVGDTVTPSTAMVTWMTTVAGVVEGITGVPLVMPPEFAAVASGSLTVRCG